MSEQGDRTEAVSSDVENQEWQINEIEEGLREADAGDFASDEEVAAVFAKRTERPTSS
jgi:RHH-type transcriptional regulator, rel operon repressor / antitoxin RelB